MQFQGYRNHQLSFGYSKIHLHLTYQCFSGLILHNLLKFCIFFQEMEEEERDKYENELIGKEWFLQGLRMCHIIWTKNMINIILYKE